MTDSQLLEFRERIKPNLGAGTRRLDRDTRNLILYLFTSTRGGFTRLKIIMVLLDKPCNMHQLSRKLGLDYKAIQHHMKVLEKNNMVAKAGGKYGAVFHMSMFLETNIDALDEAIGKLGRKLNRKKVYL